MASTKLLVLGFVLLLSIGLVSAVRVARYSSSEGTGAGGGGGGGYMNGSVQDLGVGLGLLRVMGVQDLPAQVPEAKGEVVVADKMVDMVTVLDLAMALALVHIVKALVRDIPAPEGKVVAGVEDVLQVMIDLVVMGLAKVPAQDQQLQGFLDIVVSQLRMLMRTVEAAVTVKMVVVVVVVVKEVDQVMLMENPK
ncbi:hypothetical protein ACP70R_021338 [Stipagrostis hirtigluma subsp. patula]